MSNVEPFIEEVEGDWWNLGNIARHDIVASQVEEFPLGTPIFVGSYED